MGDTFAAINNVSELATLSALASVRFAMAFLLLPILAQDTVPQLVRGAVFLAFGVVTLAMQPAVNVLGWSVSHWIGLFAKEAFLGLALGMLLAAVLWAFAAAGEIVDGASGLSQAQVTDPLSGRQQCCGPKAGARRWASFAGLGLMGPEMRWAGLGHGGVSSYFCVVQNLVRDQSALNPVAATALPQVTVSAAITRANSSRLVPVALKPASSSLALPSGDCTALITSACRRARMSGGVLLGATMPNHELNSRPL